MKIRYIAPVAMVATAAAIGLAPLAAAASTTTDTGAATVVQSPGNAQITTQPGAAALRGRRQGFCRGRIRRRNGCPVPPIYRRGDARGARSVSGGSAADLGSAPDAVNSARERLGEGVCRCHCACGVIAT